MKERVQISVEGIVQGVGFRPFVYGLAMKNGLAGFVLNNTAGVTIELEGEPPALECFFKLLREQPPPLALIQNVDWRNIPPKGDSAFSILDSENEPGRRVWISPDTPTCDDCLVELFDPTNRRYRYPFINCTNCGPRFTIIKDVPYDRERTTMGRFKMCGDCAREFQDPSDRRFHAQPNACPRCGPQVRMLDSRGCEILADDPIAHAADLMRQGGILAVKGLGGYHLAANGLDDNAVRRLRGRKHREDKPFALMAPDLTTIKGFCLVSNEEKALLGSTERPIVLLRKLEGTGIAEAVAPGQRRLGFMLPYTPLHHLLLKDANLPLVMTSGNMSEEPIAYKDDDALRRLGEIADYFLIHDRQIHMRCDDSVARTMGKTELIIRRSRGYAPQPIILGMSFARPILACGAHLKNTFCLGKERHAFLSHHIGDLENYETLESYANGIEHFKNILAIEPAVLAHDLHPEYLSTKYARQVEGLASIGVQHHHAHIGSCIVEHGLEGPVIGVAFDGLGYGDDGTIWGGEFLVATLSGYDRRAHLRYVPLAGGDRAIREPWRMAVSYLRDALGEDPISLGLPGWGAISEKKIAIVNSMMQQGINTVQTSSSGRLFDAVASILGLRHEANYEGQAAIELEMAAADGLSEMYPFEVEGASSWEIDMRPAIGCLVRDVERGLPVGFMAAKFHNTLVAVIVDVCRRVRESDGSCRVCLSGGTFQNAYLLERAIPALRNSGFDVYLNHKVPPNDGGISLGQAAIANAMIQQGG